MTHWELKTEVSEHSPNQQKGLFLLLPCGAQIFVHLLLKQQFETAFAIRTVMLPVSQL